MGRVEDGRGAVAALRALRSMDEAHLAREAVEGIVAYVDDLAARLRAVEAAIRRHRDARGHDRCWLNDRELYAALGEPVPDGPGLPPRGEFLRACERYYFEQATAAPAPCDFCGAVAMLRALRWVPGILVPPGETPRPAGTYLVCAACGPQEPKP